MKSQSYMTRALRSADPRYARVLGRLGYSRADQVAAAPSDEIEALRLLYAAKAGRPADPRWKAETLQRRIAEIEAGAKA